MLDLRFLNGTIWLAEPDAFNAAITRLQKFSSCPSAREVVMERRQRLEDARQASTKAIRAGKGKTAVIDIYGVIEQRVTAEMMKLGGTATEEVSASLDAILSDSSIDTVVFHMDSPGGSVAGVEELSDKIYGMRGRKKTYAMVDSLAASAGYWIASAAETVVLTPGGMVGSVGVYMAHVDESKALEQAGMSVTLISAGKFKTEGASTSPLTPDARGYLQGIVDQTYGKFVGALKRNRGTTAENVRKNYGEGRTLMADAALEAGMVDRVMSFDQLREKLTGKSDEPRKAEQEVLRLAQDQRRRKMALWKQGA